MTFTLVAMSDRMQAQDWEGYRKELDILIKVCSLSGVYVTTHFIIIL